MLTNRAYASHDYGAKYKVDKVAEEAVYISYVCAIAAISAE